MAEGNGSTRRDWHDARVIARLTAPAAGLALVLSGLAGDSVVAAVVVVATLLLAVTLPGVAGRREGAGLPTVVVLAGVGAVAAALIEVQRTGGAPDVPDAVVPVLALVVPASAIAQLARRDGRADVVGSIALTVSAGVVAALGAIWVTLGWTPYGNVATVVAGVGLLAAGLAAVALETWRPRGWSEDAAQIAVLAVGGVGGLAGLLLLDPGTLGPLQAAAFGLWAGATLVLVRVLVAQGWGSGLPDDADDSAADGLSSGPEPSAAGEMASDPVSEPAAQNAAEPVDEHVDEPAAETGEEPVAGADPPSVTDTSSLATAPTQVGVRSRLADEALVVVAALTVLLMGGPLYVLTRILVG
jgi:hypothetical protein